MCHYLQNQYFFSDVDECKLTGICSQNCQNSVGSYTCSCFTGFSLNEDKTTCSGSLVFQTCINQMKFLSVVNDIVNKDNFNIV